MTLTGRQLAIITPTKGRHKQLSAMLEKLSLQTVKPGQIIIADGGRDAGNVVAVYQGFLPVHWLDCPNPGQVIQRNLALTYLEDEIRAVLYLDDDIQLEPDAIENLLEFWNSKPREPAGVSLNLTNMPQQPDNFYRHLFFMATDKKGRVHKSGYNTPIVGLNESIESQWLIGGATCWRRDILRNFRNQEIPSRWAITEDLMFSYPVHKAGENLFVCASAKGAHIDDTPTETFKAGIFRGNSAVLWRYLFVIAHAELSSPMFFWMVLGQIPGRIAQGVTGKWWHFGYALGYAKGVLTCLRSILTGSDIRAYLD